MIQNVTFNTFTDSFRDAGRAEQFSYEAKRALFNYLIELEEDCDMSIELDPIAFCCEYAEYDDLEELNKDYGCDYSLDDLRDHTQVIEFNHGSLLIAQF